MLVRRSTIKSYRIVVILAELIQQFLLSLLTPLKTENQTEPRLQAGVIFGLIQQRLCYFIHLI